MAKKNKTQNIVEVELDGNIVKVSLAKTIFGLSPKKVKVPAQRIKDEMRKGW